MNYGHFAGRLGRDAEIRSTQGGDRVCNFSLAVDTGFGDRKVTLWVDCALWGDRGAKLAPYLTKGKPITVSGDVGLRTFQKRDGSTDAALTLNVQRVTLQGASDRQSEGPTPAQRAQVERSASTPAREPAVAAGGDPFNDDIPFGPHEYRSVA